MGGDGVYVWVAAGSVGLRFPLADDILGSENICIF